MTSSVARVVHQQKAIVRRTLEKADAITVLSSAYALLFEDLFPAARRDSICFIPTGLDEDLLAPVLAAGDENPPFLLFAGEYLPDYDGAFLESFAEALKTPAIRGTGIRLLIVGHEQLNRTRLASRVAALGLTGFVDYVDHQPQRDLYSLVRRAKACLLIPGRTSFWWANFAKMVDFIALRKMVLAVVPEPSEARCQLTKSGLGVFLDGDHSARVRKLTDFLLGRLPMPAPNHAECDRYTATRQVREFVDLFEALLSPHCDLKGASPLE